MGKSKQDLRKLHGYCCDVDERGLATQTLMKISDEMAIEYLRARIKQLDANSAQANN